MAYQTFAERKATLTTAAEAAELLRDMVEHVKDLEGEIEDLKYEMRELEDDLPDMRKLVTRMTEIETDPAAARKYELIDAANHPNQQRLNFAAAHG